MKQGNAIKKTILKKSGKKEKEWKEFRDNKYERDGAESIRCQIAHLGFSKCFNAGVDLHHIVGRNEDPELYYDETNMVWLCRQCHEDVHNLSNGKL